MSEFVTVGYRPIAVERRPGRAPGLFWMGGYRSDMSGAKAMALDRLGAEHGLAVTRFDYSGHGASGGDVLEGTISRWLDESLAVFATTSGPQVVVSSSMGSWLALLLVRALRRQGDGRVLGLVLIAPAVDMTEELMLAGMTKKQRALLDGQGYVDDPSAYSDTPYRITRALIEDGRQHLMFGAAIETGCPIAILQGGRDRDVPKAHALKLMQHLVDDPVTFTLVPDGDHRLSRPEDLELLAATVRQMIAD